MTTQYFEHQGGHIAYDDRGEGPLIIAVPGLGDLRGEYRFLAPALVEAGCRVVTMDIRGHGETSIEWPDYSVAAIGTDILALANHLESGPATVIGTSMAAGAAVWAAAESPKTVERLVLIGPFVRDTQPLWQSRLLFGAMFRQPWGVSLWMTYFKTLYPSRQPEDFADYLAALRTNLSEPGRLAATRKMITASKTASEQRLDQVEAPALVIMGTADPDFDDPAAEAEWVARQLDGIVALVEDAGHYPHAEMPAQTTELIRGFLPLQHSAAVFDMSHTPEPVRE